MTNEADPHSPVVASPEVMADLWSKVDDLDARELTEYALELGLTPPDDPPGHKGWKIVIAYPNADFDNGVLYWRGPEEGHGEGDFPAGAGVEAPRSDTP
ncbi:hypothetical protein [Salininema proteolyticum]|uniref:Uncharacterized protein n=1 Tax=Salininema proteolyticum TaxID=1607685 RepID=A0ABV8U4G2_9ACTN